MTPNNFADKFSAAARGDNVVYHVGHKGRDLEPQREEKEEYLARTRRILDVFDFAWRLYKDGHASLVQRRIGARPEGLAIGVFEYIAQKR